jgi:hypothetical protein
LSIFSFNNDYGVSADVNSSGQYIKDAYKLIMHTLTIHSSGLGVVSKRHILVTLFGKKSFADVIKLGI